MLTANAIHACLQMLNLCCPPRFRALLGLGVATVALCGCGKKQSPTGSVRGSVTVDGKAVTEGAVIFEDASAGAIWADQLGPSGEYSMSELPTADYVVTVVPPRSGPNENTALDGGGRMAQEKSRSRQRIPEKFHSSHSTTLRYKVNAGPNTFDLDLKP